MSSKQEKSVTNHRHQVKTYDPTQAPRTTVVVQCAVCCDQPWVRETTRLDENWDPIGVRGPDGTVRCKACGGEHIPLPPVRAVASIRSSAAMCETRPSDHPGRDRRGSR